MSMVGFDFGTTNSLISITVLRLWTRIERSRMQMRK